MCACPLLHGPGDPSLVGCDRGDVPAALVIPGALQARRSSSVSLFFAAAWSTRGTAVNYFIAASIGTSRSGPRRRPQDAIPEDRSQAGLVNPVGGLTLSESLKEQLVDQTGT
jgi:hypothetical protein